MSDIIKRLRNYNPPDRTVDEDRQMSVDIHEAADEIERLRTERDAAVKALRFLLDHGAYLTERVPDHLKAAIDAARGEK